MMLSFEMTESVKTSEPNMTITELVWEGNVVIFFIVRVCEVFSSIFLSVIISVLYLKLKKRNMMESMEFELKLNMIGFFVAWFQQVSFTYF